MQRLFYYVKRDFSVKKKIFLIFLLKTVIVVTRDKGTTSQ